MKNINDLSLNQLRLLESLMNTRNLTRTGEQMGLTQSAVSHTLKKLREALNDQLFIREGNTLVLTPRSETLQLPLKRWLNAFEKEILEPTHFEAKTSTLEFRISATDQFEQTEIAKIIANMQVQAPHIRLHFLKWDYKRFTSQIESSEIDFAIGVASPNNPNIMTTGLFKDRFVSIARKRHPYFRTKKDVHAFVRYPHILASTGGGGKGVVDNALAQLQLERTVLYRVTNFSSAPYAVENSDAIFTAPRRFIEKVSCKHEVKVFEPPLVLPPSQLRLFWHSKNNKESSMKWMREFIVEYCR